MKKEELVSLLQQKKDEKVAAVSADFDALISAAQSLDDSAPPSVDVAALQALLAKDEDALAKVKQVIADLAASAA